MDRIEFFKHMEKDFVYVDLSGIKSNDEFALVSEAVKKEISQHPHGSLYTIANISNITFDTKTKELMAELMAFNKPYVISGAIIGVDGIKRIMFRDLFKEIKRTSVHLFSTKAKAIEWLASQ